MAENTREIVLDILLSIEKEKVFSNQLIKAVLDKYDYLDVRDKRFIKRVTEGTIERQIELDYHLNHFSKVPVNKMKPLIRCLMRMSAYQLLYMDSVPDSAVCNEACKLAQKRKFHQLKGFVNGVLRSLAKNKENLTLPDRKTSEAEYLSVAYSMPKWLVEFWLEQYGSDGTEKLLAGLLAVHPVVLRFRTDMPETEVAELLDEMQNGGAGVQKSRYLPYLYMVENVDGIASLPGYEEGAFTVQDVSSALAVEAAGIQSGDLVLDICAAPGGKTMLAAEKAAKVRSRDVSERKVDIICENLERMKIENVETEVFDATNTDEAFVEKADVVLMDVPCSGLGILGKKRDIKYHVTPESLKEIVTLQKQIVQSSWQYVKPGGTLLYSTCTINPAENEEMVKWILEEFPFEIVPKEEVLPKDLWEKLQAELQAETMQNGQTNHPVLGNNAYGVQLLPGFTETDGFYFAKLRRKK
ncbi:MAG: 16S rRNA (cytosine(967)-C(5))-methyltransferase RsmB [Lachnospiraceae bacterium]|nr:16S rRNA (cytosine(967)-C(5))-methyltransferase RsmB [Lachnospiraceae bacterium]